MFYASRVEEFSTDRFGKTKLTTNRWRGWRNSHRSDSNSRLNFFLKTARFPASSFLFSPLPSPAPPHPCPAQIQPCMTILALRGIPREEEHVQLVQQSRSYGNTFCVFVTPNIWGKYWTEFSACFLYADCLWYFILWVCHRVPRRLVGDLQKRKEENKTTCVPYIEPASTGDPMQII